MNNLLKVSVVLLVFGLGACTAVSGATTDASTVAGDLAVTAGDVLHGAVNAVVNTSHDVNNAVVGVTR